MDVPDETKPTSAQGPTKSLDSPQSTPALKQNGNQSFAAIARTATDRAIVFLSTASNEALGACIVGLGATTYIVLGRVGLVLMGVVGGVVLHASWEGGHHGGQDVTARSLEMRRRGEVGLDVVRRVLEWKDKKTTRTVLEEDLSLAEEDSRKIQDFSDFRPETAAALNILTDAVIRDYVRWWYSPILPDETIFPATCRRTWTNFIRGLSTNLSRKRPADTFLEFTTNSSSIFIVFLNEISNALSASPNVAPAEALQIYLRLKPQSNLANIMDRKHQERKLMMVAEDMLESFLEPAVYKCAPARAFLREILASVVLDMTITKFSKAEWINDWIVYLLDGGEPEIMNAIDESVANSGVKQTGKSRGNDKSQGDRTNNGTSDATTKSEHRRRVSRAEEAMDEAMREAQRLTQLIVEEDARKLQQNPTTTTTTNMSDDVSDGTTTQEIQTPTSSQSDMNGDEDQASKPISPRTSSQDVSRMSTDVENSRRSAAFTSFDQILPVQNTNSFDTEAFLRQPQILTLHKAKVSIFDDGDKRPLKSKPLGEYMIQIEPASSRFPGWMIPRTYADFETLHEVLRRISTIAGVPFTNTHATLPQWKTLNKAQLREELENYISDAVLFEPLAESEGMKKFLDKDRGLTRSPAKSGFWPNPTKGIVDALTKAPKDVAGGIANVLSGVGANASKPAFNTPDRVNSYPTSGTRRANSPTTASPLANSESRSYPTSGSRRTNSTISIPSASPDAVRRTATSPNTLDSKNGLHSRRSSSSTREQILKIRSSSSGRSSTALEIGSLQGALSSGVDLSPTGPTSTELNLPPPPSDIPDDYASPSKSPQNKKRVEPTSQMSVDGTSFLDVPIPNSDSARPASVDVPSERPRSVTDIPQPQSRKPKRKPNQALSEQESQVTVELLFAVINELYTLSSAWNIRRTLLTAAKTFLLRPGNPQLENIRLLLQETLLDANTSDAGLAAHILKLRENSMPTEEELAKWPPPLDDKQKEKLRRKARKLLVERGMPQALTSVMGGAASGEALGKVFDCLQVEEVARGVMFGLMLQSVRAVTQ